MTLCSVKGKGTWIQPKSLSTHILFASVCVLVLFIELHSHILCLFASVCWQRSTPINMSSWLSDWLHRQRFFPLGRLTYNQEVCNIFQNRSQKYQWADNLYFQQKSVINIRCSVLNCDLYVCISLSLVKINSDTLHQEFWCSGVLPHNLIKDSKAVSQEGYWILF